MKITLTTPRFEPSSPSLPFVLRRQSAGCPHTAARIFKKGNQNKISLAETFPSLLPSTHGKNWKCWLGYKSHVESTRSISTDTGFIAMHRLWAELKYAQASYSNRCRARCAHRPLLLFGNRQNFKLEHNSNIDIERVRFSGLSMNNWTSLYRS